MARRLCGQDDGDPSGVSAHTLAAIRVAIFPPVWNKVLSPSYFIRCLPIKDQSLAPGAKDLRIVSTVPCRRGRVQRFGAQRWQRWRKPAYLGGGKEPREKARRKPAAGII